MTRILASDWLTESDVGGPVVGPAWPLSSKVNDFNQFLITDHTPDQDQWDKLGHSGPQHLSPAFPPLCLDAILTWIKKSWCPMCCVDLAGGGHHRNTGLYRTLVRLFHHTAMAGLIGTSWGCFVQHMTK